MAVVRSSVTPSSTFFPLIALLILHMRKEVKAVPPYRSHFPYAFLIDLGLSQSVCMHYKQNLFNLEYFDLSQPTEVDRSRNSRKLKGN